MKKILMISFLSFATLYMAACGGGSDDPFTPEQSEQSEQPENPGDGDDTDAHPNGGEPETPGETSMKVTISVGGRTITATMDDNAAGRDLLSRLPLEVTLNDFNNTTEKIFYPEPPLTLDGVKRGCAPVPGDITIYAPWGNVAIFCKSWSHSNDLIKIGHIDGDGIEALTVSGDVKVKIERQ